MKESVAIAKDAAAKKESSPTRSDNSIQRIRNEPERQLGSLRDVIGNIRRDGGTPSVESIATELSVMPSSDCASALLALQQTHGNQYVQRVVTGIQAKLKIGQPWDKYEQEADRVAEQVMRMPEPQVQRQPEEEEEKKKKEKRLLQPKPLAEQITPLVQRQPIEEEEEAEELPPMPEFRLTPPSLSLPGLSSPHFPHLELEMPMQNALRFVERRLDPTLIRPALLQIDPGSLTLPSPTETGTVPETAVTPPPESTPLVPAGPGPEMPREASGSDIIRAVMAVPVVDTRLTNLQTWALGRLERDWERLSIGEQIATITATAVIGGGALGGVLSHPETRQAAIDLLNGRTFLVPGVEGLQFEVGIRGNDWTIGFHLDVGALLPASLGFGPSSPSAFGPPPIPEGESESESGATVQRQIEEPQLQQQTEEEIQPKEKPDETLEVTPDLGERINAIKGGGRPLPEFTRAFFEPRFGQDFTQVRVHTDTRAAESARAMNARAFTVGRSIVFGAGQYAPGTVAGKRLLAHELTHVVQQTGNEAGERNKSLPLNQVPFSQHTLQRVIAIGGADLDAAGITSAQNEIVTTHLVDIVNNTRGDLLFTRDYRRNLIRDTVRDMHQASNRFNYGSVEELARDVRQRVLASLYMRMSQGRTRRHMGFSYPDRASDGTAGVGPQVNQAARSYWGPVQDPHGDYYFELSRAGRTNAYQAIVTLFTEQTNPHLRTLIHCDYLLSVLQYRAWAESIGVSRYNRGVESSSIDEPVLKWNGFVDMQLPNVVPTSEPPFIRLDTPLQQVTVASEGDLIIGDHVVFYNHESYDALIKGVGGIWRLENAIVIDRRGGENRYQGHGYFSPVPKRRLLTGMIRQYNRHISAARRLTRAVERATALVRAAALAALHADYPNVHEKVGGGWEISGTGFCGTDVTRDLRPLTMAEAPGLTDPCTGTISVMRPVHTAP